ncbi:MAG: ATP-binding protein [Candidatus Omnitrophica bacterium]|nr:ATP-binding protein [Candidatus Omnitrophota bacterium]
MNIIDYDHNFFGRQDILGVLRKRITGLKEGYRQNVALLGSRTTGKTAIIQKLISDHDDRDTIILYLDLESRDFSYFVLQFTKSLLYHFSKVQGLIAQEDLKLLCLSCREMVPQTVAAVEAVNARLAEGKTAECYGALLALPDIFYVETKKAVILVFDEFQNLQNFDVPEVFTELGRRIMTQKSCLYIVTSSYQAQARAILAEKLSLLFGNFEIIPVLPFDLAASAQLADRHLSGIKIGLQLKNFLADFTGGHPLYINILCQELIYLCGVYRQEEIYAPILTQAVENLLFNPWGVLSRHFELEVHGLCRGRSGGPLSSVLIALAEGKHRVADLAAHLSLKTSQAAQRVNILLTADIIEKNGNYYHIKDKLFKYWIKFVYERRLRAIDLENGKSRKLFKEEINKAANDFQMTARKDLSARMTELLHKFDSEALEIAGRRYKLSMFKDITPVKLRLGAGNFFDAISAAGEDGRWLIVLKKDPVHENDLNAFLEEMKKMTPKPQRCVIVSLSGLDDNAKIRALQEKLWVWNEEEINTLMRLYDEPYIVR